MILRVQTIDVWYFCVFVGNSARKRLQNRRKKKNYENCGIFTENLDTFEWINQKVSSVVNITLPPWHTHTHSFRLHAQVELSTMYYITCCIVPSHLMMINHYTCVCVCVCVTTVHTIHVTHTRVFTEHSGIF